MYKPQFPYLGPQAILSSDRVMLYSKKDGIFIIGKQTVAISTQKTLNIDAKEGVIISSPKIQLGLNANQQVLLGTNYVKYFRKFLEELLEVSKRLKTANATNVYESMLEISIAGMELEKAVIGLSESLNTTLSNTTYTN
jgi:hypothetical protein